MKHSKIVAAEALGTFILMLGGPGTAVFAADVVGVLGVAFGFGFALLVAAYAIGPISGCHINPAVTLGMALANKIDKATVPAYVVGQVIGGVVGGLAIWVMRHGAFDDFEANPDNFATNLWGENHGFYNFGAMMMAEIVLTGLLIVVVLSTTRKGFPPAAIGVSVGLALTLIHLVSIPIDNTSVNPVRSLGMAVFATGDALEQLWAFIVFPLVGAAIGAVVWLSLGDGDADASSALGDGAHVPAH
jgi:aquaporin Z